MNGTTKQPRHTQLKAMATLFPASRLTGQKQLAAVRRYPPSGRCQLLSQSVERDPNSKRLMFGQARSFLPATTVVRVVAACVVILCMTSTASSQTAICCPGDNHSVVSWGQPSSWNPMVVPDANDINAPKNAWVEQGTAQIGGIPASAFELRIGKGSAFNEGRVDIFRGGFGPGTLKTSVAYIGDTGQGVKGIAEVSGTGSRWDNSGDMYVGAISSSDNILSILSGGAVKSGRGFIGDNVGARGTANLNGATTSAGAGANWDAGSEIRVGNFGRGDLNVVNGADVTSGVGYLGVWAGSRGSAVINGMGSTWTNNAHLIVGYQSSDINNILNVQNGGIVTSQGGYIGDDHTGRGIVDVSGTGSRWDNESELRIGNFGNGTLRVSNGGQVVNFSGSLGVAAGSEGTAIVGGNGARWENVGNLVVGAAGKGDLDITTGGTVLANLMSIGAMGILRGEGTADANVESYGKVSPGAGGDFMGTATLAIDGTYKQNSSASLNFELYSATNFGRLSVSGGSTLGGSLNVYLMDAFKPKIGDSFDLIGGTKSGVFSTVNLPNLPATMKWKNELYTTGVITVVSAAAIAGDYNNDGAVDAADYATWRDNLGQSVTLPNDDTPGSVTQADYDVWRTHFGQTAGSGAVLEAAASVPEPTTISLVILLTLTFGFRCHSRRRCKDSAALVR